MTRVSLGWNVSAGDYIDYLIWLLERNLGDILRTDDKIWIAEFSSEEDAVAFKLRFGL